MGELLRSALTPKRLIGMLIVLLSPALTTSLQHADRTLAETTFDPIVISDPPTIQQLDSVLSILPDTQIARSIVGQTNWLAQQDGTHVSPYMIARIIRHESGGDSSAIGSVGELGLGQIRPELWLGLWPECGTDLLTVRTNVCYTIRIWHHYRQRHPTRRLALLAYNGCKPGWSCESYADKVLDR